jgi:hypothetical protein
MTEEQVRHVIRYWTTSQDTWQGDRSWGNNEPAEEYPYPPQKEFINKKQWRDLPASLEEEAKAYIAAYCTRYPLQLRRVLGFPMWLRFCDVWSDTGKFHLAMRAI